MGSSTSQQLASNQTVVNSMLQVSRQSCSARCSNDISGLTVIVIGGTGDINITQECKLTDINCIMTTTLDTQIENILKAMAQQNTSAMNGFTLDWTNINQSVDLYQYLQNSITQMMDSSCTFEAGNTATGLYFYVQDRNGNLNLSQSASITNSTCNMNNVAKAVTYNDATTDTRQTATITNIFGLIIIAVIIMIVIVGIVIIVFLLSGGTAAVAGAVGAAAGAPPNVTQAAVTAASKGTSTGVSTTAPVVATQVSAAPSTTSSLISMAPSLIPLLL